MQNIQLKLETGYHFFPIAATETQNNSFLLAIGLRKSQLQTLQQSLRSLRSRRLTGCFTAGAATCPQGRISVFQARGDEPLAHGLDDLFVDFVDAEVAFDDHDALRFAAGDGAILLPDAAEEGLFLAFEAAFVLAGLGLDAIVAAASPLEADFKRGEKQNRQVRLKIAAEKPMQFKYNFGAQLAAAALIGFRGVGEAVAEDDLARVELESRTRVRIRSPGAVPPGWRVRTRR